MRTPDPDNSTFAVVVTALVLVIGIAALVFLLLAAGCAAPKIEDPGLWGRLVGPAEPNEPITAQQAADRTLVLCTVGSLLVAFACAVTSWLTQRYRRYLGAALAFVGVAVACLVLAKILSILVWAALGLFVLFLAVTCWKFRHFDLSSYVRRLSHGRM